MPQLSTSDWLVLAGVLVPILFGGIKWAMRNLEEWKRNTELTLQVLDLLRGNPKAFPPTIGILTRLEKLELKVGELERTITNEHKRKA